MAQAIAEAHHHIVEVHQGVIAVAGHLVAAVAQEEDNFFKDYE